MSFDAPSIYILDERGYLYLPAVLVVLASENGGVKDCVHLDQKPEEMADAENHHDPDQELCGPLSRGAAGRRGGGGAVVVGLDQRWGVLRIQRERRDKEIRDMAILTLSHFDTFQF